MATTRSSSKGNAGPSTAAAVYAHAPSAFTLFWLAVSLPLVVWDCGYVLMRPRTMAGGDLHWPLWAPYALYGEVDYVYGWKAFNANSGFTGAQGFLNVVETVMYAYYAFVYYQNAVSVGGKKVVVGRQAAIAVLVAFSAAIMTLSKTVLYCEFFSFYLYPPSLARISVGIVNMAGGRRTEQAWLTRRIHRALRILLGLR